jgi:uncharacterized membrane protein
LRPRTQIFGHPVHLILIVFPLGLLATSFFFDLAWLATGRSELAITSSWMIFAGVLGGLAASVFGLVDWIAIPRGSRASRMGAWHGGATVVVALLFAASWVLRREAPGHPQALAIVCSACGVFLTVISGWLGSELVDRMEEM